MNIKLRQIEVDGATADALEACARERGVSVRELLADWAVTAAETPQDFESMRATGRGPWAPEVLAEDARRLAEYERTGKGVPWEEVRAWMRSWGSQNELPPPKPRKL
jgi:hypothetical protein